MRIHKEGFRIVAVASLVWALLIFIAFQLYISEAVAGIAMASAFTLIYLWIWWFFRAPVRKLPEKIPGTIYAVADGKVVSIEKVIEEEYFKDERIKISVFMSPFDIHVNWHPISGTISYTKYHPGKYLVAYHPKSSLLNERNTIVIKDAGGQEILIRQIAGVMARRIVSYPSLNEKVGAGDELGFIRFGSRIDYFLPVHAHICLTAGKQVKGRQTIVAQYN